jgi:hypothetical protein
MIETTESFREIVIECQEDDSPIMLQLHVPNRITDIVEYFIFVDCSTKQAWKLDGGRAVATQLKDYALVRQDNQRIEFRNPTKPIYVSVSDARKIWEMVTEWGYKPE